MVLRFVVVVVIGWYHDDHAISRVICLWLGKISSFGPGGFHILEVGFQFRDSIFHTADFAIDHGLSFLGQTRGVLRRQLSLFQHAKIFSKRIRQKRMRGLCPVLWLGRLGVGHTITWFQWHRLGKWHSLPHDCHARAMEKCVTTTTDCRLQTTLQVPAFPQHLLLFTETLFDRSKRFHNDDNNNSREDRRLYSHPCSCCLLLVCCSLVALNPSPFPGRRLNWMERFRMLSPLKIFFISGYVGSYAAHTHTRRRTPQRTCPKSHKASKQSTRKDSISSHNY